MKKIVSLILAAAVMCSLCACAGGGGAKNTVVVASKQFTENIILSEIYAQLIEAKTDLEVERKQNLGGTSVIMPAMDAGDMDIYVEYTGTICGEILKIEDLSDYTNDEVLAAAKKGMDEQHDMTFFTPVGLNNTYAVGLPRRVYEELAITKLSELKDYAPELVFASAHTFFTRVSDGYDTMTEVYSLSFKAVEKMDQTLMYEASEAEDVDVIIAFSTDGLLKKYDIILLEDDLSVFPPYHASALCRNEVLKAHPELNEVLDLLAGKIDDVTMQDLNYKCDVENQSIEEIAKGFLTEQGLL